MRLFSSAFPLVFLLHTVTVHANPTANVMDTADKGLRVIPRMPMPAMKIFQRGEDMRSFKFPRPPLVSAPLAITPPAPKRAATQEEGSAAPVNGAIGVHPGNIKDVKART
ncbi:hypothetical protein JOM56_001998 [Amanita muscaria]